MNTSTLTETDIISNGAKWAGQQPDTIERLIQALREHPLDRRFEAYGDFARNIQGKLGRMAFFGNFLTVSHVFNIETNDSEVIEQLLSAIRENKEREDYLAQPEPRK